MDSGRWDPVPFDEGSPEFNQRPHWFRTRCIWLACVTALLLVVVEELSRSLAHQRLIVNRYDPFHTSRISSQASQCGYARLAIFPFDAACPADCSSHRMGLQATTFYRTSSAVVFGNLTSFREQQTPTGPFQSGARVAQSFLRLEKAIEHNVMKRVQEANLPPLSVKRQSVMHMSIDYLCCLTEQEMAVAQDLRARYVADHHINFGVEFGAVQCLQERVDSITVIWIADEFAQSVLLNGNYQLANVMRAKGVPVLVDRSLQMPFHTTLIGFSVAAGQDISNYRRLVQAAIRASGSHRVKVHVTGQFQLELAKLSRNMSEMSFPMFGNAEDVKWYIQEQCVRDGTR
eukprot:TRINITY_DN14523_c0_g1_i1.p1 TRINITY_DN14523_c0_g1~~TRINITY_DN14523_c0_g1_i1.p1  ORF type:complete len:363 (-),score=40.10 TRINITY_DN14523_c0_g1_i1:323-1357(-)